MWTKQYLSTVGLFLLVNGFTEKQPTADFGGTHRHYFHYPRNEILQSPEAFENLQKIFLKKENNPYKQSLVIQVGTIGF